MPPKKRNRDVEVKPEPDPDQLDKDELKGMLRQSLDEKAELVAQMDQQKAELEAKMKEQKREFEAEKAEVEAKNEELFMHRIFLHFCPREDGAANGKVRRVYYPNCRVVQQAEAARHGTELLILDGSVGNPSMRTTNSFIYHYPVETCTELVDIFENGLKAASVLKETHQDDSSLFSLIIVTNRANAMTVPAGRENQYLVVAARSHSDRYNSLLAAYLDQDFMHQPHVRTFDLLFRGDAHSKYDQDIQDRVQRLENNEYSTVLKCVWVIDPPDADGGERAHRADVDFNRMIETAVGSGKQVGMGLWRV